MKLKPLAAVVLTVFWFGGTLSNKFFLLGNAAEASELSPRQSEIMRITLAADGWLTEDMHREFWAQIPTADRSNPAVGKFLEQSLAEGLVFQRETWKSVMLSLQAGRVIKSPDYDATKASMLSSSTSAVLQEQNATGIRNAESLMNAAANKSPLVTPNHGTFYITYEIVSQTIAGLEASHCRVQQLINPNWDPKVEETNYSDAHVRILSDCPFRREYQDIVVESGKKARMTMLFYTISQNNQFAVEFMATGGQFAVPQQSVAHIAQSALNSMGIVDVKPYVSQWRGRVSSEASGSVVSSQGTVYASVRVVDAPEHQGAWALLAVTSDSMIEAQAHRNSLEASTQLDTQ